MSLRSVAPTPRCPEFLGVLAHLLAPLRHSRLVGLKGYHPAYSLKPSRQENINSHQCCEPSNLGNSDSLDRSNLVAGGIVDGKSSSRGREAA